jgi:hypothetical protein
MAPFDQSFGFLDGLSKKTPARKIEEIKTQKGSDTMGLTIHWNLRRPTNNSMTAKEIIEALRSKALDLPFKEVHDIVHLKGEDCDFNNPKYSGPDNELRWFLIQCIEYAKKGPDRTPIEVIGFSSWPAKGSEEANFFLARYSKYSKIWKGGSFCKTQYASDPQCGGAANFLRAHLSVVGVLDRAKELNIVERVSDEGEFWEKRDIKALMQEIGEWNAMIAGFAGALSDAIRGTELDLVAPIKGFSDYEHLEAKGQSVISKELVELIKKTS